MRIECVHDSDYLTDKQVAEFNLSQLGLSSRSSNDHSWHSSFVGIVISAEQDIILSVPKHYVLSDDLNDVQTVLRVLRLYNKNIVPNFNGNSSSVESNFPLDSFLSIVDYLNQYGLYKKIQPAISTVGSGKINWKKTVQRGSAIYSRGNIILTPLYKNKHTIVENVVTHAMRYVIENNLSILSLLNVPIADFAKTPVPKMSETYNKILISKLQAELDKAHLDTEKRLLTSLVTFLRSYGAPKTMYIATTSFNVIWEQIVLNYLNLNYVGIVGSTIVFHKHQPEYVFESQKTFKIDASQNQWIIIPDYYLDDGEVQIILDAKYYVQLNSLNYKQLAYGILLGDRNSHRQRRTYNALIAPTSDSASQREHANIKEEYLPSINHQSINTIYLNMNEAIKEYTS